MPMSLFKISGTIEPPYFIGRDEELERLAEIARSMTQDIVIISPRRFGKTALLHNLSNQLKKKTIVATVNCLGMTRYADFNEKVIRETLAAYEETYGAGKRFLATWKDVLRKSITGAFKSVNKIGGSIANVGEIYLEFRESKGEINKEKEHRLVETTFDFLDDFAEEQDVDMILIFDEFQALSKFNGLIFNTFKEKMDASSRVRYIFSGSSVGLLRDVFLSEDAPLYQMTTRHFLDPIDEEMMKSYIKERFEYGGFNITEDALDLFWSYTQGIPFYFQKLGLICYTDLSLEDKKSVDDELVDKAFDEMIDEFNIEFEERLSRVFSDQQQAILEAMSEKRYVNMTEIADKMQTSPSNISSNMNILLSSMTISKDEDGHYYITDEVFKRWIKRISL